MTNERRKEIREIRKQRRKEKHKGKECKFKKWFLGLSKRKKIALITAAVLVLILLAVGIFVLTKFSKLDREKFNENEIYINDFGDQNVGEGYTNFVLFGGDSRSGEVDQYLNTDSIIIASLNNETKEIRLVSVYRDTLLDITDGNIRKCNSAYAIGGPKQAINMLNMNLDLDIKKYVTVNFAAVAELVDMLGGIEADVSEAEMYAMNRYIGETARLTDKDATYISTTGLQTLNGVQATTYARIRKGVGDDYARTERQRYVIQQIAKKALQSDLGTINKIIDKLFPQISTNLKMGELIGYATSFSQYKITETSGFPMVKGSGNVPGRGSSVFPITLDENVTLLHEFLYGTVDYEPSDKVISISNEIAYLVGNREPQPNYTWTDNGQSSDSDDDDTKSDKDKNDKDKNDKDKNDKDKNDKDKNDKDKNDKDKNDKDNTDKDNTDKDNTDKDNTDKDNSDQGDTETGDNEEPEDGEDTDDGNSEVESPEDPPEEGTEDGDDNPSDGEGDGTSTQEPSTPPTPATPAA